jgi:hypothetical protein
MIIRLLGNSGEERTDLRHPVVKAVLAIAAASVAGQVAFPSH